ncbi:MAG: 23S rRNA (guanosine(2251)-2'-O)-methyltransferase RlmB [Muribaculaceae bacterium]|nr:23S rRNA (guanosine(2251)-2'-O)-methyltransferase RlmB [Muribaculaceae bacterium]MDE6131349.1 23S rRNA (guanosine(2251)-2'-O)-methyltransferase RlmB [Muribaculaceae bacterium]
MEANDYIFGIRAVMEAIESGKQIDKVLVRNDLNGQLAGELFSLLRAHDIRPQRVPEQKLNRITRKNHQGVIAFVSAVHYHNLRQVVPTLFEDGILPMLVVLDGITDVRNFGAIARTAECCGVNAIVIPERGSAAVNADAVKTSAGALLRLPVCRERSLREAVEYLRLSGYTIVAASEKADINYTKADFTGPVAIVMGAEDVGISQDILQLCDTMVSIPMFGHIGSLNVSVAAGVMLYEAVRQRLESDMEVI